ncbi:MAG TPA: NAD(P)/FAD-dependent oxidoreductase [Planctomycetaceae bacterium]|jgi:NADH dehydrogenase|nr:NAD(P)/FAD-dependent oxidoreductase [Planctomycetaceae bacterium]
MHRVVIVGGGFGGLNAAKALGSASQVEVTLIDRRNHHLFQPLLYQVATAGLSPAEIAAPIRSILSKYANIRVLQGEVTGVQLERNRVVADFATFDYDSLILACGAQHAYFGHDEWEEFAPGLKNLEQATEIRRRILLAFEEAERSSDLDLRKYYLTFVIVGGGPTGVELAGAIGEMSRFTLARDFRNIDSKLARVILVESGERILGSFSQPQSSRAMRDLESLGVQVWTNSTVTHVDREGVQIGREHVRAATVLWAAGVKASSLNRSLDADLDRQGRAVVGPDLTIKGHPNVFVIGDQSHAEEQAGQPLPGLAPVAIQQGRFVARTILGDLAGRPRSPFHYSNKGQMATIGRSRAVAEMGKLRLGGFMAWVAWLFVHVYYLTGFKNRFFVVVQWALSYLTYRRGARLIVSKDWHITRPKPKEEEPRAASTALPF